MKTRIALFFLFLAILPAALLPAQESPENDPTLWPEPERAFLQDGPGLLLTPEQRTELRGFSPEARARWIQDFLDHDPNPATPVNELREGIARRQRLANDEYLSTQDARWRLLFLHGKPDDRVQIDCGTAFKPLEIWSYRTATGPDGKPVLHPLVLYTPERGVPFHLWVPADSKRILFTPQMEYWLQQWEELHDRIGAERFDLQVCKEAKKIDEATGVPGLTGVGARRGKLHAIDNSSWLAAPKEVAAWAREAAATAVADPAPALKVASFDMHFPDSDRERIITRALVQLPPGSGVKPAPATAEGIKPLLHLVVEGMVEQRDSELEEFRMRFQIPEPKPDEPVVLAIDRALRPKQSFVLRLKIKDETGGAVTWVSRGFRVPLDPVPEPTVAAAARGELVPKNTAAGADSLLLLPPTEDVLIGLWRAEAIVTGERIQKVTFQVDGKTQLTTSKKPFSAEVRLSSFPTEQTVRAEGYDADGKLVAADNVIVNQPKGSFNVRIVSPAKGAHVTGSRTLAKAEVFVPEGRVLKAMEFRVNDKLITSLTKPPWQAEVPVPNGDLVYLTAVATLDDGQHVEALRYLRAPENVSEVDVDLVELYAAVTDRSGNLIND
ncbi:MAG TPA: hypothetical protein VIJ02_10770, partial [Thermoanaerobaculia bacterium]